MSHFVGQKWVASMCLTIGRYPPKMIPGCHITLHTTAKADKDARLLLSAMGIPFYGKIVH